ncbi:MAG: hypothetical protein JWP87_619 [Labilithrix sp.]|nr:hypothetical protein [Labilithrix sp.]
MQRNRDTAEWLACMLVASIGLVYALWVVPYIPMQDGPHHILSVHIENHYSDAGAIYPDFYRVLPQYAGKGFSILFAPLEALMPWRTALRITLSFVALAFAWGFALVVLAMPNERADRDRRPTTLLGFFIALPWTLYMGLFPFVVGSAVGMYTLAFVLHRPPATNARRAILALLLLVQAVCHVFTATLTGLIVAVIAIASAPKEQRIRETGRMAIIGAPAAGLLVLTFLGRKMETSAQQEFSPWSLSERAGEISRWFVPGPSLRAWLVIGLVVYGIARTLARAKKKEATPAEQALAWLAVAFLLGSVIVPLHIPGWQFFAPRFALLAAVLGLVLVRVPDAWSSRARAVAPALAGLAIASSLVSASLHRDLVRGCGDALSALDAPLHFEGARLSIIVDAFCGAPTEPSLSPVPRAAMGANMPVLQLVDHGGIAPTLFNGSPSIHAIALRPDAPLPPPPDPNMETLSRSRWFKTEAPFRQSVLTELAADGMPFEGIHMVGGKPEDAAEFLERGYAIELLRGSMLIARFEGCPSELVLPPGALDREAVYYEYGLFTPVGLSPEPRTLAKHVVDRKTPAKDDGIHVPLAGRPCGKIWARVVWDADGSSSLTPGDKTCAKATRDGRILATVTREHPSVSCGAPP